jgi:hypothetical protein
LLGFKANNLDKVYYNPERGDVVVVECKLGSSELGDRFGTDGSTRVQQGSPDYLQADVNEVDKPAPETAQKIGAGRWESTTVI